MQNALWQVRLFGLSLWVAVGCSDSDPEPRRDSGADAGDDRDSGPEPSADGGPNAAAPDGRAVDDDVDAGVVETAWQPLLDAELSKWYRYLPSRGRDDDPQGVFKLEDGVLHVLGIEPPAGDQEFGYVSTRDDYADYQLRLEQRWGTRKFAPRADSVRDSGLLYHMRGDDGVWPQCVEFQIQENDIADLFMLGGIGATVRVDPNAPTVFQESGIWRMARNEAIKKSGTLESLSDWNSLELIVSGREMVHIVNGFIGQRGKEIEYSQGDQWLPLNRGRIQLQAEGAEVFYRNVQLRPLSYTAPPSGSLVLFDGSNLAAWQAADGGEAAWSVVDGALEIAPGSGDLVTRRTFDDVRLHVEFRVPITADPGAEEQARGNSGVFLQGRYEVQVLDSFGRALGGADDAGAIYSVRDASANEALPAELWQSYDIVFRAARWDGETKRRSARISLFWNGREVQHEVEVPVSIGDAEQPGGGPLRLQDHGFPVRFRNIWLVPL